MLPLKPVLACVAGLLSGAAWAEPASFEIDPEASVVRFVLGATLHTVNGTGRVREGVLRFDLETGAASGRVVVDARSLETGIEARDANLHTQVLESEEHPEISFRASGLELERRSAVGAEFQLAGDLTLQGVAHPLVLRVTTSRESGGRWRAKGLARLPYVAWGLEDPSVFLLAVDPEVDVEVDVVGRIRALP